MSLLDRIKAAVNSHEPTTYCQWYVDENVIDCDAEEFWTVVTKVLEKESRSDSRWYPRECTWCGKPVAARSNDPDVVVACTSCDRSDLPISPEPGK